MPWGSPSLHVAPASRNVCWQGVLGTRLTPLRVAVYQAQPSALRLPLTWPLEGPSPLLRGTTGIPCAGRILGLSSPGKPPAESGVDEADCPEAKRRLVWGRLVRAWRAGGCEDLGRWLHGSHSESHGGRGTFFRFTQWAVWPRNSTTRTSGGTSSSVLTSQMRSGSSEKALACPRAHSGRARPGQRPSDAQVS